ncbi:MAG: DUF1622 domain-containing protein [SAR202 cluster bacterium]|nr:DUF1622 domain-containing protein [SAR202 cluster bacterium]
MTSRAKTFTYATRSTKVDIGRPILLGLEILVAADIIEILAFELWFRSVGVLAALIIIRTFLS